MNKIVIVTRNLKAGGAERVIVHLANYFVQQNIECTILTLYEDEIFYDLNEDVSVINVGNVSNKRYIDKFLKYRKAREIIKKIQPNIVLAMPEEIGIFTIPTLFGLDIPIVISERNDPTIMPWKKSTRLARKVFYPFADGFVFQTKKAAEFFSNRIQEKGIIIPNPIDLEQIPKPYEGIRAKKVVAAGRLVEQKNFDLLIETFAMFVERKKEYKLHIYGVGPLEEHLKIKAANLLPHDSYIFKGRSKNILQEIKDAEMFLLTSNYEGMPNILIEALALGIPVISTRASTSVEDLIEHNNNGILVEVAAKEELLMAMINLSESESLQKKICEEGKTIKQKLDSRKISLAWLKFLMKLSEEKHEYNKAKH